MEVRVTGWHSDNYFSKMELVGNVDDGWRAVLKCQQCSQYWLVDEYDKCQSLFAIKIDDPEAIESMNFIDIHERFLLKAHAGESTECCKMAGCENKAVKGLAFCAHCLITKQGVYE